jgi:hypothetical protein
MLGVPEGNRNTTLKTSSFIKRKENKKGRQQN